MIERSQRGETVEAMIWRVLKVTDADLLNTVLEHEANYGRPEIFARTILEPGTKVWLPDTAPEALKKRLARAAELWS